MTARSTLGAALAALGAAMLWGTTGTAQALGPDGSDPASVGATRVALGALVLVLLALGSRMPQRTSPGDLAPPAAPARPSAPRASLSLPSPALIAIGGLAVAAYQACFFLGVARTGVAVGTVVALGAAPLFTGVLGLLLGETLSRRWLLATAGAVVGVVLLVAGSGSGGAGIDLLGVVAALGAGASYAGYTITARALLLRGANGLRVMATFFTIGALLLAPALLSADLSWLWTRSGVLMVLWLGVIATGVSYVLFQRGLAGLPASTVATLSLAEPVTATLLGVLVLREHLSWLTAVGIVVVVLSLLVMGVRRRARPAVPEPV
ncbi:DMT family transporter [Ornithinimicrobium sp. Y1694]|uniref:DMT family transporter n=1 Tax=Ornithinimicrobium sp. Y1694 TaxID=3418590 RepID=UPI003CF9BDCF